MIEALDELLGYSELMLFAAFLVFLRVGAAMALLPAFGERSVPERVRLGLALCFTMVVMPAVLDEVAPIAKTHNLFGLFLVSEVIVGLALGIAIRLFVVALQIAGSIAAQATSLSQIFGAGAGEPLPAIGHILVVSALALAVMMGLHVRMAQLFVMSYQALPVGVLPTPSIIAPWGIAQVSQGFAMAFTLAGPFVVASLIYNIALGVINRAMPQLMVAFVGAPAITAGGLILLALALPTLLGIWSDGLSDLLDNPFGAF